MIQFTVGPLLSDTSFILTPVVVLLFSALRSVYETSCDNYNWRNFTVAQEGIGLHNGLLWPKTTISLLNI